MVMNGNQSIKEDILQRYCKKHIEEVKIILT